MKREDRAQCSRARILTAATAEFSAKSYDAASVNTICSDHGISKGLIYHYFGNKDALYLLCVQACFEKFAAFLAAETYDFSDFQRGMNQYLARRFSFFRTCPREGRLFFYAILQPPRHLETQIQQLRGDFDRQGLGYYKAALTHITLREGVTEQEALDYFAIFQEVFNGYFQNHLGDGADFDALMQTHEAQLAKLLNLMLYGIAKEKTL